MKNMSTQKTWYVTCRRSMGAAIPRTFIVKADDFDQAIAKAREEAGALWTQFPMRIWIDEAGEKK